MDSAVTDPRATPRGVGHSHLAESEAAGRESVRAALTGHQPTAEDVVVLFASIDYDIEALYRAAAAQAAPAGVFGCTNLQWYGNSQGD